MTVKLNSVYNYILLCSLIVCAVSAVAINPEQILSNLGTSAADVKIQKNNSDSKKNSDTESSSKEGNVIVEDTSNKTKINIKESLPLYKLFKDCKENSTCFEGEVIQLIDNMDNKSIPLYQDMIFLEKTSDESPTGSDASETLMKRFDRFLRDHSIRVRIPNLKSEIPNLLQELLPTDYADISLRSLATIDASEGRGRLRIIRSIMVFIILFMEMVFSVLVPVLLFKIKILGLKGLWASVVSVIMTVAIGLKALLSTNNVNDEPSTRFSLGFSKPYIIPEAYHGNYYPGWSRTPELQNFEYPYRDYKYYPSSWGKPAQA